jgi:hypothetical protein
VIHGIKARIKINGYAGFAFTASTNKDYEFMKVEILRTQNEVLEMPV